MPMSAIAALTTSLVSPLRCCSGRTRRSAMPTSAPPNTQPKTRRLVETGLMLRQGAGTTVYTTPFAPELGRYHTPFETKYVVPLTVV